MPCGHCFTSASCSTSSFTIDEPDSGLHRKSFLADHAAEARDIESTEARRRERKAAKADADEPEEADAEGPDEGETD